MPAETMPAETMPADPDDTMTIRQMCNAFDVTPRALRFYEAKDLLRPVRIGTRRLFTRAERARLTLILRGKRFGFSLEDLRQVLDLYDRQSGNVAQIARAVALGRGRLAEMQAERAAIEAAMAALEHEIAHAEALLPASERARSAA